MEQYSIFNSENGDRKYLAEDFAEFFLPFFKNGVFNNGLKVIAGTGMQIEVETGRAFCNGYRYRNKDNSIVKPIAIADGEQSRIDNVVLRLDLTNRTFTCQIVQGSYSNSPVAPALVRDTTTYDLRLAKISVPAGTTAITDDLITDCRFDSSDCGNVIQAVQSADFTDLYKQFETEFYNWFDDLEVTLDENTATNLTNRVINLENNSAFIDTCTDEDLEDITDTNECLKDNEDNVINPKIPRYEQGLFYKTSETKTGEKWIDGKPIYRRVIQSTVDQIQNVVNSLNIEELISHYGLATSQFDNEWPIPNVAATEPGYNIMFFRNALTKQLEISFGVFYPASNTVFMILKYTKTTDSSSS